MATRILFLGADALDKDTVLAWAEDGTLPTFRRLLREGAWGTTHNPPGLYVGAVWPSFWTSVGPDRHARYCYEQLRPGSYEKVRVHPTDTRAPAFWDAIGAAGRRVAVIDVPKTHVVEGLNGVHVVDWGTHDPDFQGPLTWPASLAADLVSRHGRDEVGNCNVHGGAGDYEKLRAQLVARIDRRKRMLRDIMAREDWDAFIAVFSESHCVGHQCWHLHDTAHVRHDAALAGRIGDPVRDVYVAIDAAIGELIEAAGPGTDVIVLGSHGMRSHYDASFMLDAILRRIERPDATPPSARTVSRARRIWSRTPKGLRVLLSPLKGPARQRLGINDLASRRFFAVPNNDAYGAIRINLAGREPAGRVQPGAAFERECAMLEADLRALINVDTGEPAVLRVLRTRDLYRGPMLNHLPDLMVEWNRRAPITRVHSAKTGEVTGEYTKCRTGDHAPTGFFAATGARVIRGPLREPVSVMDFGPTIADRLGVTLSDVEGRSFAAMVFAGAGK
ncbi:MAG: alkaline phosphatase family protein [Candidatus Krumholzibacteria bacterium]|nr:alkaline phosphatase family protein [Candidatus Krumholzibacteria bacterium]MDH4336970.1 alkaline phosphatase family protein [Candidatus Krumholzibacteria bacterium]MDH5269735.1 alkaline phosphatase family protein [Candidatus Krumholzibacteria bacterium]